MPPSVSMKIINATDFKIIEPTADHLRYYNHSGLIIKKCTINCETDQTKINNFFQRNLIAFYIYSSVFD